MRSGEVSFALISLRMFPGSPNPLYNLIFPHIPAISLTQNIIGCLIGQLPYNLCIVKAGQMLGKLHSRSEIIDLQTTTELIAVSLMFLGPLIYNNLCASSRKNAHKKAGKGLSMSFSSYMGDLSTSDEDLESFLKGSE